MTAFHHLTPAEQEMAVQHHARQYWAALNRGSFQPSLAPDPLAPLKVILALARADAEESTYSEIERRTILSPRSVENRQ